MIGVKNCTGKKIVARYDGHDYRFEPDEKVVTPLSEDAARHIFGYGEKDKKRALLRLGWVPNGAGLEDAIDRLNGIKFLESEEQKFKGDDGSPLPRSVAPGAPVDQERTLSFAEEETARKLAHQEGVGKQFGKR